MADHPQPIAPPGGPATPGAGTGVDAGASSPPRGDPRRASELALLILFLLVIAAVPVGQTCLELARHEQVQFTDVFRDRPTAQNLRQYEATLKEKSWFQQKLRPLAQRFLFATLHDTGAKGILGLDRWLFYRPDLRYVVEPDRPETGNPNSKWEEPNLNRTERESVVQAITRFRDQLKERGIGLVVVPIPGKPSIYPDELTHRKAALSGQGLSPTLDLLKALDRQGVATVDLFAVFLRARREKPSGDGPLYLAQDTHWTPLGARLAAKAVAARLRELGSAPAGAREFRVQPASVRRWGDVLEMMQIPGLRQVFGSQTVACEQVLDPVRGPMLPTPSDRPGTFRAAGQQASVLVLGDSFCRIYQYPEPASLGELVDPAQTPAAKEEPSTKRLLPGSAGFISHLALALKAPVDAIYSDGGASTDVRRKLSTNPEMLEGKKVVVWEFVERDIALGAQGWEEVPLPPKMD